jgi:hypothetical protein
MLRCVRTESAWEFGLNLVPPTGKIIIRNAVGRVGDMVVLADVNGVGIAFAIVRVVTQWLHAYLGTLGNHYVAVIPI